MRTILDSGQSARRDRQVVAHEVEFRELRLLRKIQLVGVRHADLASLDREHLGGFFFAHKNRLHRIAGLRRGPQLFVAKGHHRIHFRGAMRRQVAGQQRHASQNSCNGPNRDWIALSDTEQQCGK